MLALSQLHKTTHTIFDTANATAYYTPKSLLCFKPKLLVTSRPIVYFTFRQNLFMSGILETHNNRFKYINKELT